jgi:hypothetical protein
VEVTLLTLKADSPAVWTTEISKISPAPPASGAKSPSPAGSETPTTWEEIMDRSYIEVTANGTNAAVAKLITDHVNWDRYLSLIQGRVAFG